MKTTTRQEQAENLLIQMDAVQAEIEQTNDYRLGPSCVRQLEGLKSDIEALGFQVKRVPTGWALVSRVQEVAQVASPPTVELHEDAFGLYAEAASSKGKTVYTVRVCARRWKTVGCDCRAGQFGRMCRHREMIDVQLAGKGLAHAA